MEQRGLSMRRGRGGHVFMTVAAAACGLAGALGAIAFRLLIRLFQAAFFGGPDAVIAVLREGPFLSPHDPIEAARALSWPALLALPALGGLLIGPMIWWVAREAQGHGVPEVMEAVALRGGVIRLRSAWVKIVASAITIGSGGSAGQEGPIVQIGAGFGSGIGQLLRVPARQLRTLVGCGAAAGLAATFNAPIAGALFAAEVIIGDFAVAQFSPIVISSVVATVISRYFLGNYPSFQVAEYALVSGFELGAYLALGLICGLVALTFMRCLDRVEGLAERLPGPGWARPALGGAAVGAIACVAPNVLGVGYSTVNPALQGAIAPAVMATLLVAKLVATSLTIGTGGSGGVFAPSLYLGAMTGGLLGSAVHAWFPWATSTTGAYALVGMGALVSATTHAPLSAILIIFEMTQRIEIIPPLMAACVVSTLVASFLQRESIYVMKLKRRGVQLPGMEDANPLKALFVSDVVDRSPDVLPESASFEALIGLLVNSDHTEFFVVDARGELLGAISLSELRRVLVEREYLRSVVVAGDLMDTTRLTLTEQEDLDVALRILDEENVDEIAVVDASAPRRLVGSLHRRDLIAAYREEQARRDAAGALAAGVHVVERVHEVEVAEDFVLRDVAAPHAIAGRTLGELDLRARTGAMVLLIRKSNRARGADVRVPSPSDRIEDGDVLIAAGSREALARLEAL